MVSKPCCRPPPPAPSDSSPALSGRNRPFPRSLRWYATAKRWASSRTWRVYRVGGGGGGDAFEPGDSATLGHRISKTGRRVRQLLPGSRTSRVKQTKKKSIKRCQHTYVSVTRVEARATKRHRSNAGDAADKRAQNTKQNKLLLLLCFVSSIAQAHTRTTRPTHSRTRV